MKRLITAAAISVTLFAAGCSSDSTPASQAEPSTETPATETPTTETAYDGGLLTNAGFKDGSEGWEGNAVNVIDDGSGSNNINFASVATAGNAYDVNLSQILTIEMGKTYDLSFKAKSDVGRTLLAGIGLNSGDYANRSETVELTPEWKTYTLKLTAGGFGDDNSRVLFDMGAAVGEVWLDDISLKEGTSTVTEPSQIDLPVSFEGDEVDYTVTDFGGAISTLVADPADATNMVIKTIKAGDAATWAGTTIGDDVEDVAGDGGLATTIPFTATATTMSVRVYSPDAGIPVRLKVERSDDVTVTAETDTLTTVANEWETLVFDLNNVGAGTAAFDAAAGYDKASIFFNFDVAGETVGEKTYYWDDVTFGGEATTTSPPPSTGTEPTDAPPAPAAAATDVISIYSDAYTDITPVDTNPNWGQGTVTTGESIAGNNVLKMSGLDYQGIAWNDNKQDVSCFAALHVDYWTADATALQVFAIGNLAESAFDATVVTGSWQSLEIPLSTYSSVGLTEAREFKFVGDGTVYIDNLYFSNTAGAGTTCAAAPVDAAPTDTPATPTASSTSSIYSDAYTDLDLSAFPTGWSNAGLETQTHAGNFVQKMTGGYVGIEPAAGIDGTNYSHMHIDVWAAEGTSVLLKVRDYGPNGAWDAEGDDSEISYVHTLGTNSAWEGIDVPLTNATKASISQIVIDAQNAGSKIYFDNIYFYNNDGGTAALADFAAPVNNDDLQAVPLKLSSNSDVLEFEIDDQTEFSEEISLETTHRANLAQKSFTDQSIQGYACNVSHTPSETTKWSIVLYNFNDPQDEGEVVFSTNKNRKIQSVACLPSGKQLIFSSQETTQGDTEIYSLDLLTNEIVRLTDNDTDDNDVSISQDGTVMAWQKRLDDGRQAITIRNYDVHGEEFTEKSLASANPFVQPSLSANGKWLALVQLRTNNFLALRYNVANSSFNTIHSIVRRKRLFHPSISNDGNMYSWVENKAQSKFVVKNISENTITKLVTGVAGIEHPYLVQSGESVMYSVGEQTLIKNISSGATEEVAFGNRFLGNYWMGGADLSQIDLPVDFEGTGTNYTVTDFGGTSSMLITDPTDSSNKVVSTVKGANAATWAGTTVGDDEADVAGDGGLATVIPFTDSASTMSVRVYSPDAGMTVRFKVERSDDVTVTAETETLTTVSNEWETLVFDLNNVAVGTAAFNPSAGYDKASIFFNFNVDGATAGEKTYLWDDVTFGGESTAPPPATGPTDAPNTPAEAAVDVISIYSDAYTDITPVITNPNWGQATVTTEEAIAGNKVLKMSGLNYQGIAWNDNKQNVSCFESLHVDYWTADATELKVFAIGKLTEAPFDVAVVRGSWQSLDIPLSNYEAVGLTEAREFKFVGNGTVYVDNLYFSNTSGAGTTCGEAPADPAPTDTPVAPTVSNTSSIYSEAYTDLPLSAFPTSWSTAGLETQVLVGNEVQKMTGGFVGIEPAASIDGTAYSHMHMDVWAAEGESVLLKVRDYGLNGVWDANGDDSEISYVHTLSANSMWESIDVPLTNATKASLSQIVIDAQKAGSKIYFDNIYFY